MNLGPHNFLTMLKQIVTDGGRDASGETRNGSGFKKRDETISLQTLAPGAGAGGGSITDSTGGTASATFAAIVNPAANATTSLTADVLAIKNALAEIAVQLNALQGGVASETNARVLQVTAGATAIGQIQWLVPRDYDETSDWVVLRVWGYQKAAVTDATTQLDATVYVKSGTAALSADKNPTISSVLQTTTPQVSEIVLSGYGLKRDDVVYINLITNGANVTAGDELQISGIELVFASSLVSFNEGTTRHKSDLR